MKTNTHQDVPLCYVKCNPSYHAENTITVCLLILFFHILTRMPDPGILWKGLFLILSSELSRKSL